MGFNAVVKQILLCFFEVYLHVKLSLFKIETAKGCQDAVILSYLHVKLSLFKIETAKDCQDAVILSSRHTVKPRNTKMFIKFNNSPRSKEIYGFKFPG